jgi:hypothetical protein
MPLWKAPSMVWPRDTSLGHSCESKSGRILGIAELYKCETWCDWLQVSNHLTICSSMWIIIPNRWNRKSLKPAARKVERGQWFIVIGERTLLWAHVQTSLGSLMPISMESILYQYQKCPVQTHAQVDVWAGFNILCRYCITGTSLYPLKPSTQHWLPEKKVGSENE